MSKQYYIELNGKRISVTEEVYFAFKRPAWRERKRGQARSSKELSLEALVEDGFELSDESAFIDEIVEDKLMLDMLFEALSELTDDERYLINELFFNNKSEREISKNINAPHSTIHICKNSILSKLKKSIENKLKTLMKNIKQTPSHFPLYYEGVFIHPQN